MIVTKLVALDKKRSRVWLDEEFAFVLYKGELRRFKMVENAEISEKDYLEITQVILPKRAKLRAMNLLLKCSYTEKQLRDKLKDGEYSDEIINLAIDYVSSYGYIDDLRLAEEYIRNHIDSKSKRRLKMDLMNKGVSKDIIEKAFINTEDEGFTSDELEQAQNLLRKRGYYDCEKTERSAKEYAKQYNFLARKGFDSAVISEALGTDYNLT